MTWQVAVTFQLLSSAIISQGGIAGVNDGYLMIHVTGIVSGNGYDATTKS